MTTLQRLAPTDAGSLPIGIDRLVRNVETGHFERSLSALTAIGALVTAAEIYFEHDSASFGNKMMWVPVVLGPVGAAAGVAGFFSRRMAKTALPLASFAIVANGLQGTYLHARGIGQKPGRLVERSLQPGDGAAVARASARHDGWRHGSACSGTPAREVSEAGEQPRPYTNRFPGLRCARSGQALGPSDSRCRARPPHGPHDHAVLHPGSRQPRSRCAISCSINAAIRGSLLST